MTVYQFLVDSGVVLQKTSLLGDVLKSISQLGSPSKYQIAVGFVVGREMLEVDEQDHFVPSLRRADRPSVGSPTMIQEFKDFIAKGNVIMLAVGFIMGVAFQSVVTSLVDNVIMPIAAIPFGQPSFDDLVLTINNADIMYGAFLTSAVVFLLTALAVFLFIVRPYNAWQERNEEEDEAADEGPSEIDLLTQIRDSLARG